MTDETKYRGIYITWMVEFADNLLLPTLFLANGLATEMPINKWAGNSK